MLMLQAIQVDINFWTLIGITRLKLLVLHIPKVNQVVVVHQVDGLCLLMQLFFVLVQPLERIGTCLLLDGLCLLLFLDVELVLAVSQFLLLQSVLSRLFLRLLLIRLQRHSSPLHFIIMVLLSQPLFFLFFHLSPPLSLLLLFNPLLLFSLHPHLLLFNFFFVFQLSFPFLDSLYDIIFVFIFRIYSCSWWWLRISYFSIDLLLCLFLL